jgi:hypothetical protein
VSPTTERMIFIDVSAHLGAAFVTSLTRYSNAV